VLSSLRWSPTATQLHGGRGSFFGKAFRLQMGCSPRDWQARAEQSPHNAAQR